MPTPLGRPNDLPTELTKFAPSHEPCHLQTQCLPHDVVGSDGISTSKEYLISLVDNPLRGGQD